MLGATLVAMMLAFSSTQAMPTARQMHIDLLTVQKPNCTTMADFQDAFTGWCPYYLPTNGSQGVFNQSQFIIGDANGQNADTQAQIACFYTLPNIGPVESGTDVSLAVAWKLGAKGLSFGGVSFDVAETGL